MKLYRSSLFLLLCLMCTIAFAQQISIDDTYSAQDLITNHLIEGCVETSNVSSQVNGLVNGISSFGYFEKAGSNFPFENGIILSTGRAISGGNGQDNTVLHEGLSDWLTDPDLESALGITNTLNATSIEFDFLSISNRVQFNYILASEEYFGDFPCNYSDGFALLIKEAGTTDPYQNIAILPGSSIPVNTNTIHPEIVGFCPESNVNYFDGYNFGDTNYNGRTKVLSAVANINPNVTYHIKLIIADQTDKNYDSAVFIEGNSFSATVDLGNDITTCAENLTLDGNIQNPSATYSWYLNTNLISGANQSTLTVNQSGVYTVSVTIPVGGSSCVIQDTVEVNLSSTQTANPIADFELCDDQSMDGVEIFDLSLMDTNILASVPPSNYSISYHYSPMDAVNDVNAITNPIQNSSNNQTIHVRIEDIDNGCLAYSSFQLVVFPRPIITNPSALEVCDDLIPDGSTQIDLTIKNSEITNGQSNLIVSYHHSQADANSGANAIPQPYVNVSPTEQLFVRVTEPTTGCSSTTTLTITVLESPEINLEDLYIDACDQDHDGMATFDLTSIIDEVIQGLTGVSVTFHETAGNAQSGANPIANPNSYDNTSPNEQNVHIRVVDNETGCASIRSFEIHSNLLLTGTNIQDFSTCDDDADNAVQFDLNDIAQNIINGLEDVSVLFYESASDQNNQTNELNPTVPYFITESPTLIYITINSPTCSEIAQIQLIINDVTQFPPLAPVDYCDDDTDGLTAIDLHSFDSYVTGGQAGFTVKYYATQTDADASTNALPGFYTNTTNPLTLYPRISETATSCGDVNTLEIHVIPAPEINQPDDIVVCDDDQDGMSVIDLSQMFTQLVNDTSNKTFTFYDTNEELEQGLNPYTNINNFNTGSRGVHVKVTNTLTGCWSKAFFNIYVNTSPIFIAIEDYKFCEVPSDGLGDFIFATKDSEILNGQAGKQTLYYLSQSDADNRMNEIDKNLAYVNTSNPQTIFVRLENLTDQNCYETSSFHIEVGTSPEYNQPLNIFTCDDISNDASELFDLSPKIDEITQGINDNLVVTFHTTSEDAENSTNPIALQFANTVNPQQIYARIDNGSICASITSFTLNVIQVAQANLAEPLQVCDSDYDGLATFDLTLAEIEILDVRQDNIEISYYTTMEDLDAQTNPISNPSAYTNVSNPQTVYVRLTNNLVNCYLAIPQELLVNLPPAINPITDVDVCDNATHGFDLTQVNTLIVDDITNRNFTYYTTAADAIAGLNPLNTNYTYTANNTTLYVRIENAITGCIMTHAFNLRIRPLPNANTPIDLEACDDDFDGVLEFDLTSQNASILGAQNPSTFSVSYHNSLAEAASGTNALPNLYFAFNEEIIYTRVENNNTGCFNTTQFGVIIHPRPMVVITDQIICLDNLPLLVSANTNNPNDTYLWSTNETTPEIDISVIGTYSVTVTTEFGCETTQVFNVTESESATIEIVETIDFSDPNNITITISGIGNYMYQIDDETPQESNILENVGIGYHTITVIDLNGCQEVSEEVLVLDFPKFLTPNADGYFDTWHITGVETLPGTVIYIYDRFGKQIHFLTSETEGWNGLYNNSKMPATDYWFVAHVKGGGYDFEAKGHFALRR